MNTHAVLDAILARLACQIYRAGHGHSAVGCSAVQRLLIPGDAPHQIVPCMPKHSNVWLIIVAAGACRARAPVEALKASRLQQWMQHDCKAHQQSHASARPALSAAVPKGSVLHHGWASMFERSCLLSCQRSPCWQFRLLQGGSESMRLLVTAAHIVHSSASVCLLRGRCDTLPGHGEQAREGLLCSPSWE